MSEGVRCMWMRGGTSKGAYFLARDVPQPGEERGRFLLRVMGSPDIRQIDGMGGASPLTSKVAVVQKSARDGADVDYLFLQVFVDRPVVSDAQNCGNILAGVGPFAIERGLVAPTGERTVVRIFMENTGQVAIAAVATPGGKVSYDGDARIDGVPGSSAAVPIAFLNTAGSSCGALLPSGNAVDVIDGTAVTLIDNGMPCIILRAADFGLAGTEAPADLQANTQLRARLEAIRLAAGPLMNLGDVAQQSVPKLTLVSRAANGGAISTRTFIPHRCHDAIGVLGAVSVASACLLPAGPAAEIAVIADGPEKLLSIEHPSGEISVVASFDAHGNINSTAVLRTARKLFDGFIYA